jgi:hypothetical protein
MTIQYCSKCRNPVFQKLSQEQAAYFACEGSHFIRVVARDGSVIDSTVLNYSKPRLVQPLVVPEIIPSTESAIELIEEKLRKIKVNRS